MITGIYYSRVKGNLDGGKGISGPLRRRGNPRTLPEGKKNAIEKRRGEEDIISWRSRGIRGRKKGSI